MANDFPVLPRTNIEVVEESEYKQDIFDRLCSGWSPARVSAWLRDTFGVQIAAASITRFFEEIPDVYILPPTVVRQRLLGLDVKIDSLTALGQTLRLMEERLEAYETTFDVATKDANLRKLDANYRKELKTYFDMLVDYTKLLQGLGLYTSIAQRPEAPPKAEEPTLRDLLKEKQAAVEEAEAITKNGS